MSNARNLANLLNTDTTIATADVANGGITTAKLADDAVTSAKLDTNIAIGGTLGVTGETTLATHLNLGDDDKIKLGASGDLEIYHDGSNSYVDDTGTGDLRLRGNDQVRIQKYTGENMITCNVDDGVQLYHDNVEKFVTTSGGAKVTGDLEVTDDIDLNSDGAKITFGGSSETITLEHVADTGLILQGSGTNTQLSLLSFHTSNGTIPDLRLGKSSSNTVGTFAETANGESIGQIRFTGQDSNNGTRSAGQISVIQSANSTGSTVPAFMRFDNSGSERMRIVDEGLLINTTDTMHTGVPCALEVFQHSGSGFVARFKGGTAGNEVMAVHNFATSGTRLLIAFKTSGSTGTLVGRITSDGSTTNYATSSDYRLKENVTYDFDATTRLKQLKPARFNWIADEDNKTVDGFIAHEVSSIVPEAVNGEKDAVDADGNIDPQGIDQSKLVPLLVKTIQELEARITVLETA
jgi:hypothetical protein